MTDVISPVGIAPAASTAAMPGSSRRGLPKWLPTLFVGVAAIGVWELVCRIFAVPKYVVPMPSLIADTFFDKPGVYLEATWVTGLEAALGLAAAVVLGVVLAVIVAQWRAMDRTLTPYLVLLQVTPTIAIAPMLTVWFGYDTLPKVITAFLTSFFPIVITTAVGLRSADRDVLDMLSVISAPQRFVFFRAKIWFALPHFLSALKVAVPGAVVGAIIGEFIASTQGLGYIIMTAQASLNTGALFVAIVGSAFLGVLTFALASFAERRLLHWHESQMEGH